MISTLKQLGCLYGSGILPATGNRFTHSAQLRQLNRADAANSNGERIASEHTSATDAPIMQAILRDPPSEAVIQPIGSARFKPCAD